MTEKRKDMAELSYRDRQVLAMRKQGKSLEGIGCVLNLTRERIRQIEAKAILKIQDLIRCISTSPCRIPINALLSETATWLQMNNILTVAELVGTSTERLPLNNIIVKDLQEFLYLVNLKLNIKPIENKHEPKENIPISNPENKLIRKYEIRIIFTSGPRLGDERFYCEFSILINGQISIKGIKLGIDKKDVNKHWIHWPRVGTLRRSHVLIKDVQKLLTIVDEEYIRWNGKVPWLTPIHTIAIGSLFPLWDAPTGLLETQAISATHHDGTYTGEAILPQKQEVEITGDPVRPSRLGIEIIKRHRTGTKEKQSYLEYLEEGEEQLRPQKS